MLQLSSFGPAFAEYGPAWPAAVLPLDRHHRSADPDHRHAYKSADRGQAMDLRHSIQVWLQVNAWWFFHIFLFVSAFAFGVLAFVFLRILFSSFVFVH